MDDRETELNDVLEPATSSQKPVERREGDSESVDVDILERKVAQFFLSMQTVLHISKSAIQKIVEQLHDILDFSKCYALDTIKEILAKHNIVTDNNQVVHDITDALFQTNPLFVTISAQNKFSTDYRRSLYFKKQFELIEPIEYLYNRTHKKKMLTSMFQLQSSWSVYLVIDCFWTRLCLIKSLCLANTILFRMEYTTRRTNF